MKIESGSCLASHHDTLVQLTSPRHDRRALVSTHPLPPKSGCVDMLRDQSKGRSQRYLGAETSQSLVHRMLRESRVYLRVTIKRNPCLVESLGHKFMVFTQHPRALRQKLCVPLFVLKYGRGNSISHWRGAVKPSANTRESVSWPPLEFPYTYARD